MSASIKKRTFPGSRPAARRSETVSIPLALRIDDRVLSRIVTRAADVLAIVDEKGLILEVNRQGRLILGYAPDEVCRLSIFAIDPDMDAEQLRDLRRQADGRECVTVERRLRCKDGSIIPVEIRMGVVKIDEAAKALLIAARDITERKRSQELLLGALMKVEESDRLKTAFLANMSHEIRTPLNVILGFGDLINQHLREIGDNSQEALLSGVRGGSQRLMDTVHHILDMSKMETGTFALNPERVLLFALLQGQVEGFQPLARKKGISLRLDVSEKQAAVLLDRYCLSRALENLLDNAIKFTDRGAVTVGLDRDESGTLRLTVSDTGVGIDPSFEAQLFKPFSQEQSGSTRRFDGAGLGLALVKRYLEINHAELSFQSLDGKGTTFTIRFPPAIEEAGARSPVPTIAASPVCPAGTAT